MDSACRHSCRGSYGEACVLRGGSPQPFRIKAARWIRQTIVPELFQSPKVGSLCLWSITGHWHIPRWPLGLPAAEKAGSKKRK